MRTTNTSLQLGPQFTPSLIRRLLLLTLITTLISALVNPLFHYFDMTGPQEWFSLSWNGIRQFFLWQPLTALFVQDNGWGGISFWYLISLGINLYMLWAFGSALLERAGAKQFLIFYLLSGITVNILTLVVMPLLGQYATLSSPAPSVLALLTAWILMHPENEMLFFFIFPVKAKWLLAALAGCTLLINLSQGHLVNLVYYMGAILFGYIYSITVWGFNNPLPLGSYFKKEKNLPNSTSKIVHLHTGKPVEKVDKQADEEFIDAMLAKISERGTESLTEQERLRLNKISEKKSRRNHFNNKKNK